MSASPAQMFRLFLAPTGYLSAPLTNQKKDNSISLSYFLVYVYIFFLNDYAQKGIDLVYLGNIAAVSYICFFSLLLYLFLSFTSIVFDF